MSRTGWGERAGERVRRAGEGGIVALAVGFTLVAASGAAFLAVGPRVLGPGAFSGTSLAWVVSVLFGLGVATPTEQLISRRRNAGDRSHGRGPSYWLRVVGVGTGAAVGIAMTTEVGHHFPTLAWSLVALLGWVLVSPQRGELLGQQAIRPYAVTMMLEGCLRGALVMLAVVWSSAASVVMGASIGLPLLVSAALARHYRREQMTTPESARLAPTFEQVAFVVTALGYQACLNLPPLALSWKLDDRSRDFVGAFVVANSWMRLPTILVGSITVAALAALSRMAGSGSPAGFHRVLRRSGVACLVLAVGGAVVCAALARPATTFIYGSQIDLPAHGFAYLGLSTALAIMAIWLSAPLMALRHAGTAATIWGVAAVLTIVVLAVLPLRAALTFGLVLPLLVITVIMGVAVLLRVRAWSRRPAPEPATHGGD